MAGLVLKNIYKTYKNDVTAVKDFSMEIKDGEFIVFVGPSGCGKSTVLRMIAGLEEITSGELYINGNYMNDVEPKDRNIAMVFQNYALYPFLDVYDNIAFGLKLRHVPKEEIKKKVEEVSKVLGLEEYLKRKPGALSGGQRQRVALGRAIVKDADIFLFDEPLSNLDAKLRTEMRSEIIRLYEKLKTTFIYVTHDQEEALTMSDRIAVMHDGVLEQLDVPMEIYEHPKTKFVAGFIGESNIFDGKVTDKKDNVLTVQTEAGMMQVCGADFEVGEEMHVAIRPEYMDVSKTPVEGFDLPGTVKDFIYQGTVVKTALDIKNGQEIKYSRFEQDTDIAEGNQVYVYWRPEKAVAIKKSM